MIRHLRFAKGALACLLLLGMTLLLIFSLASVPAESQSTYPNYCEANAGRVVVLFDRTTRYDDSDKEKLIDSVVIILQALSGGERLIFRTIEDSYINSRKLFDGCVPTCAGRTGPLSRCTEGVLREDRQRFVESVNISVRGIVNTPRDLNNSDIFVTIKEVAAEELAGTNSGAPHKLFIFSDLIENSTLMPANTFMKSRPEAVVNMLTQRRQIARLHGVAVRVFGIGRRATAGRAPLTPDELNRLRDIWSAYFSQSGASSVVINLRPTN